jgi:16S rRNA C1402 N4-methylase RsmH
MLNEINDIFSQYIDDNDINYMIDCTLGCGGHSLNLLKVRHLFKLIY